MRAWVVGGVGLVLLSFAVTLAWDLLRESQPAIIEPSTLPAADRAVVSPRPAELEREAAEPVPSSGASPRGLLDDPVRELTHARADQQTRQHPDGSVRDRVGLDGDGRPHGAYAAFQLSGAMSETGAYEHGHKQGTWRAFHESGAVREETTWDRGVQTGWVSLWDSEGHLLRRSQFQGVLEGDSTTWYADGGFESRGKYAGGRREGRWEFWLPSGEPDPNRSGMYNGDQRTGD